MPFDGIYQPEIVDILLNARKRLNAGWCHDKWQYRDKRGGVCVIAAIFDAAGAKLLGSTQAEANASAALKVFQSVIRLRNPQYCVAGWNDDPKRTKRQVLAAFDRAIAKVSHKEFAS